LPGGLHPRTFLEYVGKATHGDERADQASRCEVLAKVTIVCAQEIEISIIQEFPEGVLVWCPDYDVRFQEVIDVYGNDSKLERGDQIRTWPLRRSSLLAELPAAQPFTAGPPIDFVCGKKAIQSAPLVQAVARRPIPLQ
jgi:hypothetical protein